MPAYLCPKGHESSEEDFCSVCGSKIVAAPAPAGHCPDCGAAREPADKVFCEDCGYNFVTGVHGEPKPAVVHWEVAVSIDPALRMDESPEAPASFQPVSIALDKDSNLIGRRSDKRAIFPEVALDFDDAVSHRHALLNTANGAVASPAASTIAVLGTVKRAPLSESSGRTRRAGPQGPGAPGCAPDSARCGA